MFKQSPPESICVIRLSAIGDTCHALAVVRTIQDTWPETRITWIIGKTEAGLLADIPDIEFIIFDKNKGRGAYKDVAQKVKGRKFDVALCMHASMRANWLCRIIPSDIRLGFDYQRAKDFQWLFTNRRIKPRTGEHSMEAMMGFAQEIGAPRKNLRWDIPIGKTHEAFADQFRTDGNPVLLISPCSSNRARNFRNWSAENYAAAANYAQQKYAAKIILTGGPSTLEQEYGTKIARLCGPALQNLVGKTSLKQLLALMRISDAVICPDSGPAHMATTLAVPVIGLYATTNPARTGPYLSQDLTVNSYPAAVKRYLGKRVEQVRWGERVRDPGAMGLIRLASVTEMIDRVFQKSSN